MHMGYTKINKEDIPETFASFFSNKINNIINDSNIEDTVFNGTRLVNGVNEDFMTLLLKGPVTFSKTKFQIFNILLF